MTATAVRYECVTIVSGATTQPGAIILGDGQLAEWSSDGGVVTVLPLRRIGRRRMHRTVKGLPGAVALDGIVHGIYRRWIVPAAGVDAHLDCWTDPDGVSR